MSIPVPLDGLRGEIDRRGAGGYLITVSGDGRPHAVTVTVTWEGDILVTAPGNRTVANAAARPLVTLLWPPAETGGHTLLVDGTALSANSPKDGDNVVTIRPTGAVLHRAATDNDP